MKNKKEVNNFYKKNSRYIYPLEGINKNLKIGNKAKNLGFLQKKGFKIPTSYICIFAAYDLYLKDPPVILNQLKEEIQYYINDEIHYSVRSSANVEDESDCSFAGQFKTFLNVKGIESIVDKIEKIWISTEDQKPRTYRSNIVNEHEDLKMAIIIQEMVIPQFSGVVFTRNPINGLNEIIIESVPGFCDSLVQDGITPDRWVYKWEKWIEKPDNQEDKINVYQKLVKESTKIAKSYGKPVDLEWCYDGNEVFWLQLREITTFKNTKLFSNKMAREFLPGIIKPLIFSVNIPIVGTAWKHIFRQLIGKQAKRINVNNLVLPFYYRAYFNMGVIGDIFEVMGMPRDLLERLAGIEVEDAKPKFKPSGKTFAYLPRMMRFGLKLSVFSKYLEKHLRKNKKKYNLIKAVDVSKLDENACLEYIDKLFELNIKASYFAVLAQLLNNFYVMIIKKQLEKINVEFESIDLTCINERLKYLDSRHYLSVLYKEFKKLPLEEQDKIKTMKYQTLLEKYAETKFIKNIKNFTSNFGYLRDNNNDFSQLSWEEMPDIIVKMICSFGEMKFDVIDRHETMTLFSKIFKSPFWKMMFRRFMIYREYRDVVTSLYLFGYSLFRPFFLRIATIFKEKGYLTEEDDIFYINLDEVRILAKSDEKVELLRKRIYKRKNEIIRYENIHIPNLLYDETPPEPIIEAKVINELQGVSTSKGHYIGPVKIVKGLSDIDKILEGDVIAIPYSDVSWTPLFTKAKAVISESGGILSHCSIVAREYNIPAIVSVRGAMELKDNMIVSVDAYAGKISILDKLPEKESEEEEEEEKELPLILE